jgi:hypothetical protein
MKLTRVGIDLAKNVFHLHGVDRKENPMWRQRLRREKWLKALLDNVEPGCETFDAMPQSVSLLPVNPLRMRRRAVRTVKLHCRFL